MPFVTVNPFLGFRSRTRYAGPPAAPPPVYQSHGVITQTSSSASSSVAVPASLSAGDLIAIQVHAADALFSVSPTLTAPTGWTRIAARGAFNIAHSVDFFYKIATSNESALALSFDRNVYCQAVMVRITGANAVTAVEASAGAVSPAATTVTTPTITTLSNNALVFACFASGHIGSPPTWTAPTGYTKEFTDDYTSPPNLLGWSDKVFASPAATGPLVWSETPLAAGTASNYGVTFAVRP
jgi:hypothetical protein